MFHVKLPVFTLVDGKRGILVSASVPTNNSPSCVATLFAEDGTQRQVTMETRRVRAATLHGPFVVLVEAQGDSADHKQGLGIVGPDGSPVA